MRLSKVVKSPLAWVGYRWFRVRRAVQSRWRRARGRHGAFKHAEISPRASRLTELWENRWSSADPLGYELRVEYADQWVRFHSLPDSKRYAENDAEYDEILRRHLTVLRELQGSAARALQVLDGAAADLRALGRGEDLPRTLAARASGLSRGTRTAGDRRGLGLERLRSGLF